MKNTIPVLLLTGYLGSGKTTLVNKILSNRKGIKFAVIVNDIGEVNIDETLIEKDGVVGKSDDSLMALTNGCICCTLKMDLIEQLRTISTMGKFDYIVIEASGICEPEPIARTICSIPFMNVDPTKMPVLPQLDCIVTVVDAKRMVDEFSCAKDLLKGNLGEDDLESLVIQQVEFCNIILVNKASLISKEELDLLHGILRKIQPSAEFIDCDFAQVDFDKILNTKLFNYDSVSGSAAWVQALEGPEENDEEGEADEYGISTFVYTARPPMDINKFDSFVAKRWPKGIIRVKGLCYFTDDPDSCMLFEQAGTQISLKNVGQWYATMSEEELQNELIANPALRKDWDDTYGDRMQKLVFIGRNLDHDLITSELDFCLDDTH